MPCDYHVTAMLPPCGGIQCQPCCLHAVACCATPCYTVPCHTVLCRAVSCHAMPCHIMPYYAMPCHAMPLYGMAYHTIPYHYCLRPLILILYHDVDRWRCHAMRCHTFSHLPQRFNSDFFPRDQNVLYSVLSWSVPPHLNHTACLSCPTPLHTSGTYSCADRVAGECGGNVVQLIRSSVELQL